MKWNEDHTFLGISRPGILRQCKHHVVSTLSVYNARKSKSLRSEIFVEDSYSRTYSLWEFVSSSFTKGSVISNKPVIVLCHIDDLAYVIETSGGHLPAFTRFYSFRL